MKIVTPTILKKQTDALIEWVNDNCEPIMIETVNQDDSKSAVLISKKDWEALEETLYLIQTGTMVKVQEREQDNSGFTNIDKIDWDKI